MPLLSKREWTGAAMLIAGGFAALVFIASSILGVLWLRSAYTGAWEVRAIWAWVSDPKNHKDLEPVLAFQGLIFSFVSAAFSFLCGRMRQDAPADANATTANATIEWQAIRGDLIKTVRSHWIEDYQRHSLVEGVRIRLGAEKAPNALDHPFSIERNSTGKSERLTNTACSASLMEAAAASSSRENQAVARPLPSSSSRVCCSSGRTSIPSPRCPSWCRWPPGR